MELTFIEPLIYTRCTASLLLPIPFSHPQFLICFFSFPYLNKCHYHQSRYSDKKRKSYPLSSFSFILHLRAISKSSQLYLQNKSSVNYFCLDCYHSTMFLTWTIGFLTSLPISAFAFLKAVLHSASEWSFQNRIELTLPA